LKKIHQKPCFENLLNSLVSDFIFVSITSSWLSFSEEEERRKKELSVEGNCKSLNPNGENENGFA
jgi:hypothetical protein